MMGVRLGSFLVQQGRTLTHGHVASLGDWRAGASRGRQSIVGEVCMCVCVLHVLLEHCISREVGSDDVSQNHSHEIRLEEAA